MIATIVDEGNYLFKMTKYLILSLAKHMPDEKFCLVLVNGTGKYDDDIKSWHPKLILKNYTLNVNKEYEQGYQFCYMTLPLYELLVEYNEPLIYMDGDIVVRGSLQPIFDDLKTYDYMVRYRPFLETNGPLSATHGAKVNNGVTAFANNDKTRNFTKELKDRIVDFLENGGDPIRWNKEKTAVTAIDQELLWLLYLEYKNEIKFLPTNDRFNDSYFNKDSIVWHAKGVTKSYPEYLIECHKYGKDDVNIIKEYIRLYYKKFKKLVKSFLIEPKENFYIKELEDILKSVKVQNIVIVNSDFYLDNQHLLKDQNIKCYDTDPVVYYRNKDILESKRIYFKYIVYDTQQIKLDNIDLLICEEKNLKVTTALSYKIKIIKDC